MPDRAAVHAMLARFHDAGLTPVLSTNGSVPDADIEVTRGPLVQGQAREVLEVRLTEAGRARLEGAKG